MATITRLPLLRHLRAEATRHILHFRNGKLVRSGTGLAYFFNPVSAAIAEIPASDLTVDIAIRERSRDFQDLVLQGVITYRVSDPELAASRIDFGVELKSGSWLDDPLDLLAEIWQARALDAAREIIARHTIVELLENGTEPIRTAIAGTLTTDSELSSMGLQFGTVQIVSIAPSAELEKALGTPTREKLQEKADEALFQRRALAVENERAIAENELSSEIELARRREELISREGENRQLEVQQEARAKKQEVEAAIEREKLAAEGYAEKKTTRATADAEADRMLGEARAANEERHFAIYENAPPKVLLGLALRELAGSIEQIQHLNMSPNLLSDVLMNFLSEQPNEEAN